MAVTPEVKSEYYLDPVTGQRYVMEKPGGTTDPSGNEAGLMVPAINTTTINTPVTPTIYTNAGGTTVTGSSVVINSGAAAGSRHIEDVSPIEAEALLEIIGFVFAASDLVKYATLSLSVQGLGATEVQALKLVVNGDIVSDATAINNEDGVSWVLANETLYVTAGSNYITRIAVLATNSGTATSVATGAKVLCMGYK